MAERKHSTRRLSGWELTRLENYEAFFPGIHRKLTIINDCMMENGWDSVSHDILQTTAAPLFNGGGIQSIPIDNLIHATHSSHSDIRSEEDDDEYHDFKPHKKCGKKYDIEEEGTYVQVRQYHFKKVPPHKCVLPGKLSWWSPDISSWKDSRPSIWKALYDLRDRHRIFLAPYLLNPPESRYGRFGFVLGFKDLLSFYKQSRTDIVDDKERAVYLRVGGTLQYRYEVCHVVLVCTKYDQELKAKYPSLSESDVFDHKGFIQDDGKIVRDFFQSDETIDFKPEFMVKCVPKRNYFSYETMAVAFYYPQESDDLVLTCTGVKEVYLRHMKCTKQCKQILY